MEGSGHVTGVKLASGEVIPAQLVIVSCGVRANVALAQAAGIAVDRAIVVDKAMETNIPGVFACGNVLHVHDLVDFVSQEAQQAGRRAARFLQKGEERGKAIRLTAGKGVRYTVPAKVDPCRIEEELTVRFLVDNVYRGAAVMVSAGGETLQRRKKLILTPGEMEEVRLRRKELLEHPQWEEITISLEVAP